MTMTIPLLKIRGLCKDFVSGTLWGESTRILSDVDMEVDAGEIRGIVGESGSGKTTLARCSLRLLAPSRGVVEFDGQDLATLSPAALRAKRREFQMVFQDLFASLNPAMTVGEILREPLRVHRIGPSEFLDRRVRELLDDVSLNESLLDRRPAELSGGQQQRVGIARALALKPRLLVADEPVSALDVSVQAQILNLLADLKRRYGLALILISHSLYAVHYLCTSISVMYQGRIVEEAPAVRFFEEPRHPYSKILLDSMPVMDASKRDRGSFERKDDGGPLRPRSGCSFHPRCPQAFALCRDQVPLLTETNPGERVACFLYSQK
jgi:oligopeptide/dipeptide ABC transporter ATP-binding protein